MNELTFQLQIMPAMGFEAIRLEVEAMRAHERLSEIYELSLEALCDPQDPIDREVLQREAWLSIERGNKRRVFHGVIADLELHGFRDVQQRRRMECHLTLASRSWLMSQRKTSRIFQDMRVDEVVRAVLAPYFIPNRWILDRDYPKRAYCTQFEETDLDFVKRLTAEAGIFFYFENPNDTPSEVAALSGLASGAADALGGLSQSLPQGTGAGLAGVGSSIASVLPGLVGGPREVMVFADNEIAYPAMNEGRGSDWRTLVGQVAGMVTSLASTALGAAGAPEVAGGVQQGMGIAQGIVAGSEAAPRLRVRGDTGALSVGDDRCITGFRRRQSLRSQRFTFREYDPDRPQASLTSSMHSRLAEMADQLLGPGRSAVEGILGQVSSLANIEGLAGQTMSQLDHLLAPEQALEVYAHHSDFLFPDWDFEQEQARRMARSARRRVDVATGSSVCPWIEPGRRVSIDEHELETHNQSYVIVDVVHELRSRREEGGLTYRNRFECVPSSVAYVPARPDPRRQHVCLTATVQAGDGTDIHTETQGRVRVKFHWDRGQGGQRFNTCWLRVMQPWAGPGYGTLFLPREGSEVVVTFEGGDPDRPLVLGSVYNGATLPPTPLPQSKTKTGIRTASTPGGHGANELWFEDAAGREQVYIRAHRDFDQHVLHDRSVRVDNDERRTIAGRQNEDIGGEVEVHVGRSRDVRVQENDTLRVEGDRRVVVRGSDDFSVEGGRSTSLTGDDGLEVQGNRNLLVRGDSVSRHEGNLTQVVGSSAGARSAVLHVEGSHRVSATNNVEITADEALVLRCGESVLRLTPDSVEIASQNIVLQGDGARLRLMSSTAKLQADDRVQAVANQVLLKASGAALGLSSEAAVEGSRVLLNSPAQAQDSVEDEPVEMTTIELVDEEGNPIADQPYRIIIGDREISGVLDDEGKAEIELDEDAEIVFPGVTDVEPS